MKIEKNFIPYLITALLLIVLQSNAQQIFYYGKLSYDQAVDISLHNSHNIKQVDFLKKENQEEAKAAKALRLPNVGIAAGYFLMSDDIHLDLTPVRDAITPLYGTLSSYGNFSGVGNLSDAASTQVVRGQLKQGLQQVQAAEWDQTIQKKAFGTVAATAMWPIYTGGKIIAANKAAGIKEKEADELLRQKSGELMSELAERYFGLCLAQQAVKVRQDVFNGMENHLNDAVKVEKQALIAHADVLNAQVYHAQAERELSKAKHTVYIMNQALVNTLAINENVNIIPASELFYLDSIESVDYFKANAIKNNPLLQQVQTKKDLAFQGYKAEQADRFPTVAMQGTYNIANIDLSPYIPRWMVGVGAKWTLFEGASRDKKIKAASYKIDQVKEVEQKAQSDIATVIDKLYNELQMYREQLAELTTAKKYAEEYVRVREKAFHEEMTNATEVVDARLALSKVRIERLEAMYGFDKTLSQILQYAGISEQFSSYQNKQGVITESYQSKN